jgi:hypothetical protein
MPRMSKIYYQTSKGEKKLNCYHIPISRKIVEEAKLQNVELIVRAENGKIIIEKK